MKLSLPMMASLGRKAPGSMPFAATGPPLSLWVMTRVTAEGRDEDPAVELPVRLEKSLLGLVSTGPLLLVLRTLSGDL
jgi:hypothetical protein